MKLEKQNRILVSGSSIDLPSNRNFGYFFCAVFLMVSIYFYYVENVILLYMFGVMSVLLFLITILQADILLPLNKLWIRFGLFIGRIVSPIVMGLIFYGIFTPVAILMRLNKRDELILRFEKKDCHWIKREGEIQSSSFKNQF